MGRQAGSRDSAAGGVLTATIALTGATGFLGRHVRAAFARRGIVPSLLIRNPDQSFVEPIAVGDLGDPAAAFSALGRPDTLVHLAWDNLPNYHSAHHLEIELHAQVHFLRSVIRSGVRRIVVAGTCLEYGMAYGPLEETTPTKPITAYGEAKCRLYEALQEEANETQIVWARLFYMYGPGQASTALYSQLKSAIERGDTSFDMSGGEQLRDFLPVEEAADRLALLASGQPTPPQVLNICSGEPISVRRLVEQWVTQWDATISLNLARYPYPDYEPLAFWGDTARFLKYSASLDTA